LQLHRCRSDAEAIAVVTLADAKVAEPQVNVRIAGEEADLSWPATRHIVEIDGGTYHQDKLEDARKTAIWRAAGWHVERLPADVVYDDPDRLIRAARRGS
jgi:very-short-patch-repair endonuclease